MIPVGQSHENSLHHKQVTKTASFCRGFCLQFQKRQARIGVEELFLALLRDIFLECGRRLGIVAVEAVQDFVNVRRPLLALVEGLWHLGQWFGSGATVGSGQIFRRGGWRDDYAFPRHEA